MNAYLFRDEEKPKFNFGLASALALLLLSLLLWLGNESDLFQLSAAEIARLDALRKEQERDLTFRFMDAPEDIVEKRDAKFLSDADHLQRSQPSPQAPNQDPDPFSQGDTYELKERQAEAASRPAVIQPPSPQAPERLTEKEAKEAKEAVTEEADVPDPEKEAEEKTEDVAEAGDLPLLANAPKPYHKLTEQERSRASQQALADLRMAESDVRRNQESSQYHNPTGSSQPMTGLTVETNRSDLGDYLRILRQLIKGNWRIPSIARYEVAGVTGISFRIHKDGSISDVYVALGSNYEPLDTAALNAINNTHPAPPLPAHVEEEWIPIKFGFYYNMRPRY